MREINKWYYNSIPSGEKKFIKFLSNAHELGHKKITKYEAFERLHPLPYNTTATIPTWVFDNHPHAATTAFWNTAILMNSLLYDQQAKAGHITEDLSQNLTFIQYVASLWASEKLGKSAYGIFTDFTYDYLFSKETLKYTLEEPDEHLVGNILEHYLNPSLREDVRQLVGDEIADVLDKALVSKSKKARCAIALELRELLMQENEEEQACSENEGEDDNKQCSSGDNQESESDNEEEGSSDEGSNSLAENSEQWQEENNEVEAQPAIQPSPETIEKANDATEELNIELKIAGWGNEPPSDDPIRVYDIVDMIGEHTTIEQSDVFNGLGLLMRQIEVINNPPTMPEKFGSELLEDELERIIIDQKVMGEDQEEREEIIKEVVILCDFSGSTLTDFYYGNDRKKNLWQEELEAAKGAYLELKEARIVTHVYGHNAPGSRASVYRIAAHTDIGINNRFDKAGTIAGGYNYDDRILQWLATNAFTVPEALKFIIVLSDGKPCPTSSDAGVNNTIEIVQKLRHQGFIIFSTSIVADVVETCDAIYGKEWNINASQGNVPEKLRELFLSITEEYR
jgi:hypothetical protein